MKPFFLNVNKPSGMTAHDVVSRVRRIVGMKQVGHGGTLDPLACGVLPVAVGKACRLLRYLSGDKVYLAEILLGTATSTDDIEGEIVARRNEMPSAGQVAEALGTFVGRLEQFPPLYSAVHHNGKRLYELARQGRAPESVPARVVEVRRLETVDMTLPVVRCRIECSSGTYIRSIARDLGKVLGCGGCLQALTRERSGPFELANSVDLETLAELQAAGRLAEAAVDPAAVLPLPALELDQDQMRKLRMGQSIIFAAGQLQACRTAAIGGRLDCPQDILASYEGEIIAVCRQTAENRLKPEVVVADAD